MTCLFAGADAVKELSGGKNWFMFSIMQSITFAAGVYIILQGVRMVIAEIVPAFKGISDKLVPNARPALDCPVVFPYAPNAVLVGFLSSFAAGLIGMFTLYLLNMIVIIHGVVPHFFVGAAAGYSVMQRVDVVVRFWVPSLRACLLPSCQYSYCRCWVILVLLTPPSVMLTLAHWVFC